MPKPSKHHLSLAIILFSLLTSVNTKADINRFDPFEHKCGTYMNPQEKETIIQARDRNDIREHGMQAAFLSAKGRFLIHYDTVNTDLHSDAVDPDDIDQNGIPDFVDSTAYYFEYVLDFYTDTIGFLSPYPDQGGGGTDAFDVYLIDWGNGKSTYYGMTEPEKEFGYQKSTSWIVLDNNFSIYDSTIIISQDDSAVVQKQRTYTTHGYSALKVTIAHEFHHAVQNLYGLTKHPQLNEMFSTYYEDRIFPEINDYFQYTSKTLRAPNKYILGNNSYWTGYGYAIFGQYLEKAFGDGIFLEIWEEMSEALDGFTAMDIALKNHNSSFIEAWCEFTQWLYYTGSRSIEGQYLPDSKSLPELHFYVDSQFEPMTFDHVGSLYPLEIRAIRCHLPPLQLNRQLDTLDIIFTNKDLNAAIHGSTKVKTYTISIAGSELPNYSLIESTGYYLNYEFEFDVSCRFQNLRLGGDAYRLGWAYPNPYFVDKDDEIFFCAPQKALVGADVLLVVYDYNLKKIFSKKLKVGVWNDFRGIYWLKSDMPGNLSSGVYFYSTTYLDDTQFGKFAIRK